MPFCLIFLLNRRSALSKVSPSRTFTSDTVGLPSFRRDPRIRSADPEFYLDSSSARSATACCRPPGPESTPMTELALSETPTAALDGEQRVAVEHGDGPCLVIAGPGSGKTRIIVERFHRLSALGAGKQ